MRAGPFRVAFAVAAMSFALMLHANTPASAATRTARVGEPGTQRVGVIVDTGSMVKRVCVRFTESSISGVEALQRAGVDPVLRTYGGQGSAVCSLCGQGCPADGSCLTCGGGNYWAYFRAPVGSSSFALSRAGASSTRLTDGDVEGWVWGSGSTPPVHVSIDSICGPASVVLPIASTLAPTTTIVTTTAPTTTGANVDGSAPTDTSDSGGSTRAVGAADSRSSGADATVPTSQPNASGSGERPGEASSPDVSVAGTVISRAIAPTVPRNNSGSPIATLAAIVAVCATFVIAGSVQLRRRMRARRAD
jgi:hypothetical protein